MMERNIHLLCHNHFNNFIEKYFNWDRNHFFSLFATASFALNIEYIRNVDGTKTKIYFVNTDRLATFSTHLPTSFL